MWFFISYLEMWQVKVQIGFYAKVRSIDSNTKEWLCVFDLPAIDEWKDIKVCDTIGGAECSWSMPSNSKDLCVNKVFSEMTGSHAEIIFYSCGAYYFFFGVLSVCLCRYSRRWYMAPTEADARNVYCVDILAAIFMVVATTLHFYESYSTIFTLAHPSSGAYDQIFSLFVYLFVWVFCNLMALNTARASFALGKAMQGLDPDETEGRHGNNDNDMAKALVQVGKRRKNDEGINLTKLKIRREHDESDESDDNDDNAAVP